MELRVLSSLMELNLKIEFSFIRGWVEDGVKGLKEE
jgi:hypothetical protein